MRTDDHWLELHIGLRDHPKTARLRRRLGVSLPQAIGHVVMTWTWAVRYAPNGDLSRYDADVIADAAGWDGDSDLFLAAMIEAVFLDRDLHIHDWQEYARRPRWRSALRQAWEGMARRLRPLIFERDGYRCRRCGSTSRLEVDHVIPLARGGSNDPSNLQTLCFPCNRRKGAF